jgi:hypothetical protein
VTSHACNLPGCSLEKEPLYEFKDTGCAIVVESAGCRFCERTFAVIEGDGADVVVCYPCLEVMGRIIRDPASIDAGRAAEELAAQHADFVAIRREDDKFVWEWIADWPGKETKA